MAETTTGEPSLNNSDDKIITSLASNVVITLFVVVFLIVGTTGNVLTIVVIQKTKSLRIPSNVFLQSLCCSDLISALICSPLWMYRRTWGFEEWALPAALCKFYWVSDFATNYVTSLHIMSFAVLRFIAIKRPFQVSQVSKRKVMIYVLCLWLISIIVAFPLVKLMGVSEDDDRNENKWPSCSILRNSSTKYNTYVSVTSPIFFYFPEICVIVLSLCIARALVKRRRWKEGLTQTNHNNSHGNSLRQSGHSHLHLPDVIYSAQIVRNGSCHLKENKERFEEMHDLQNIPKSDFPIDERPKHFQQFFSHQLKQLYRRERSTFTQLGLIVVAFMIGYIPQTIYLMWTSSITTNTKQVAKIDYWFGVTAYLCLRFSECMNPVMYNLGSSKIRNASKKLIKETFRRP